METDYGNSGDNNGCASMWKGSGGNEDLREMNIGRGSRLVRPYGGRSEGVP
jgi:hypothetical protein